MAATIIELYLWAPNSWFRPSSKLPSSNEVRIRRSFISVFIANFINSFQLSNESCCVICLKILQWLLCLTTKVLCEGRKSTDANLNKPSKKTNEDTIYNREYSRPLSTRSCGRRTMPEYQLIASFLSRISLGNVRSALKWIHNNN